MARWPSSRRKTERYDLRFDGGLNQYVVDDSIADNEAVSMKNAASHNPPALSSALVSEDVTNAIEAAGGDSFPTQSLPSIPNLRDDGIIHFIYADLDVTTMKWGYLVEPSVGATREFYEIEDLSTLGLAVVANDDYKTSEYDENTYAAIEDMLFKWTGPTGSGVGTVTSVGTLPSTWLEMSKLVAHKFKMYAISQHSNVLHFSKSGDPEDFTASGDAGFIEVITPNNQPLTEIAIVADKIAVFTKNSIFLLYGETASNFQLQKVSSEVGCISGTLVEMDDAKVYFVSENGLAYQWDGYSLPIPISRRLDVEFPTNSTAYKYENKYCVSRKNNISGRPQQVYSYNVDTNGWFYKEEPDNVENGVVGYVGGVGIARGESFDEIVILETESVEYDSNLVSGGGIIQQEDINSVIYEYETKRVNFDFISGKTDLLEVAVELDYRGSFKVELYHEDIGYVEVLSTDEQEIVYRDPVLIVKNYPEISRGEVRAMVPPQYHNLNNFRIRMSGKGSVKIYGLQLRVRTYDV